MNFQSKSDVAAACYAVLGALLEAKNNPLGGIPNGHLYAQLMGEIDFEKWEMFVNMIKTSGHVTEENHLLKITAKGATFWAELDRICRDAKEKAKAATVAKQTNPDEPW